MRTVLLVDDEPHVLGMLQLVLERAGLSVLPAQSSAEAVGIWNRSKDRIHVLVTDVELQTPSNGWDLAKQLMREKPSLSTILVSAYPAPIPTDDQRIEFLQKPCDIRTLIDTIRARQPALAA